MIVAFESPKPWEMRQRLTISTEVDPDTIVKYLRPSSPTRLSWSKAPAKLSVVRFDDTGGGDCTDIVCVKISKRVSATMLKPSL